MESLPYADEWSALRAKRQQEYEQMISLMRWGAFEGALMDVTNEIAQNCSQPSQPPSSHSVPKSIGFSTITNYPEFGKGRM